MGGKKYWLAVTLDFCARTRLSLAFCFMFTFSFCTRLILKLIVHIVPAIKSIQSINQSINQFIHAVEDEIQKHEIISKVLLVLQETGKDTAAYQFGSTGSC